MDSKKKKCSWSPRKMKSAVRAIRNGAKLRPTAALYGIPVMTLSDYSKKDSYDFSIHMGRRPVFSREQETEIREQILLLAGLFYGMTPQSLKAAVYAYAESNNVKHPFNKAKKEAGKDWLYGFLKRNPEISIRRPEPTSVNRIVAFNATELQTFFDNLSSMYEKHKFGPHRIFNVDETGINAVHKPGKILAPKGIKQVGAATSWERGKNITVCCCISATGQYVPPLIIYPRLRMHPSLEQGGPNGSIYKCSKSGWMIEELFYMWLMHFAQHTKPSLEDPVLVILDNHSSHISMRIYEFCRQNGINMLTIPPHTSHRTQPLDLTVYSPLKAALYKECDTYMKLNQYEKLTPLQLIPLFTKAYLNVANAEKAVNGFRAAGIWPFDANIFNQLIQEGDENLPTDRITAEQTLENIVPETENLAATTLLDLPMDLNEPLTLETESKESNIPVNDPRPSTSGIQNLQLGSGADSRTPPPENLEFNTGFSPQPSTSRINQTLPEVQKVKKQIFGSPKKKKTPECSVQFSKISPAPENKNVNTKKSRRTKQHSTVLTATPMKSVLKETEVKRIAKKIKQEKSTKIIKKGLKNKKNIKSLKKQIENEISSSSDGEENIICDDEEELDDDFDEGVGGETGVEELCVICGDFGKDRELWYRCVSCGSWAHALCSGYDSANNYHCGFCM